MLISSKNHWDAIIVGSGPNGLAAAIHLAQNGLKVLVIEAANDVGGGLRSAELTLPGFIHDPCATVHALAVNSPFLSSLPLANYGLRWVYAPYSVAHPLNDGRALTISRSIKETAAGLGRDGNAYQRLMTPLVHSANHLLSDFLGPFPLPPRHPLAAARFAPLALLPAAWMARLAFRTPPARALFAGMAAHAILPLDLPATAAFSLVLHMLAHTSGFPLAQGGSARLAGALGEHLQRLGGEIRTGWQINHMDELPPARLILLDLTPREVLRIVGDRLPAHYRQSLSRYRYGPGIFKVDWALDAPIPWKADNARRALTIHLGGTFEEIAHAERAVWNGKSPAPPFVILVQPTPFDPHRAPPGKHIAWAYAHVPHGSREDYLAAIEDQIERFAPGFQARILARHTFTASDMQAYNPNYVGGDINSGAQTLTQLFTRPVFSLNPYRTPLKGVYLCSASTPPGGGVHGMAGYHAARAALKEFAARTKK
ncbi:phytoene dehydrogenase [Bellilinea caldifistulae]|uniref:FAD-dependent oxidoreductase n=1 Tax=Bellilinea caldifistulae TaxID=360411 RepID=A0A0N8GLE9_9CHLR|nr:NAD(P)/FAD-dependent oxidoreductase [Bellilinea caldifistulae]KPL72306.1 FAD-dependent oxidoreductase [Bellilinea caldifistulae]GAP09489.1 phytoene dehydrogenase [Bellilinea caldifistulae]